MFRDTELPETPTAQSPVFPYQAPSRPASVASNASSSSTSSEWIEVRNAHGQPKRVPERNGLYFPTRGENYGDAFDGTVPKSKTTVKRQLSHECPEPGCDKAYSRPSLLKQHLRSHYNERCFVCSHEGCGKGFFRRSHLKAHMQSHTVVKRYHCSFCGKGFNTRQHLDRHEGVHKAVTLCPHPGCREASRTDLQMLHHLGDVHGSWKFRCTFQDCGRALNTERQLQYHWEKDHKLSPLYRCQFGGCDEQTDNWLKLQKHVKKLHAEWMCHHCHDSFADVGAMHAHEEAVHGLDVVFRGNSRTSPGPHHVWQCPEKACLLCFFDKDLFLNHYASHAQQSMLKLLEELDEPLPLHELPVDEPLQPLADLSSVLPMPSAPPLAKQPRYHTDDVRSYSPESADASDDDFRPAKKHCPGLVSKELRPSNATASAIDKITGAGYAETRTIPCVVAACEHRFHRRYDRDRHVAANHAVGCAVCPFGHHQPTELRDHMAREHRTDWPQECYQEDADDSIKLHLRYLRGEIPHPSTHEATANFRVRQGARRHASAAPSPVVGVGVGAGVGVVGAGSSHSSPRVASHSPAVIHSPMLAGPVRAHSESPMHTYNSPVAVQSPMPSRAYTSYHSPMSAPTSYPTQTPTPGSTGSPAPLQQLNESVDYAPFDAFPLSAMSPTHVNSPDYGSSISPAMSHSALSGGGGFAGYHSQHHSPQYEPKKEDIDPVLFGQ